MSSILYEREGSGGIGRLVDLVRHGEHRDADACDPAAVHLPDLQPDAVDLHRVTGSGQPAELRHEATGNRLVRPVGQFVPGGLGELVEVEQTVDLDVTATK